MGRKAFLLEGVSVGPSVYPCLDLNKEGQNSASISFPKLLNPSADSPHIPSRTITLFRFLFQVYVNIFIAHCYL